MIDFLKKYHAYFWIILIIGLILSDHHFRNKYKELYKTEGFYTVGKIRDVKPYGRGTGYDFVYTFQINDKEYESQCDVGNLDFNDAKKYKENTFLVVYLKSNVNVNRIYVSIPVSKDLNQIQLKNLILNNTDLKKKLDTIPYPSWFWNNYF
ncbi:hypothetical protein [Chryseobacterium sp. SIMBA_038]|uniref:hypothetical protein n=1 Tax=Chryseobacterium sp. SIMBA_038 TaxID=3085780 RepID=UPI00397A0842